MLVALLHHCEDPDDRPTLMLGLTADVVAKLVDGQPFDIDLSQWGVVNLRLSVCYAPTDAALAKAMESIGVPPLPTPH